MLDLLLTPTCLLYVHTAGGRPPDAPPARGDTPPAAVKAERWDAAGPAVLFCVPAKLSAQTPRREPPTHEKVDEVCGLQRTNHLLGPLFKRRRRIFSMQGVTLMLDGFSESRVSLAVVRWKNVYPLNICP